MNAALPARSFMLLLALATAGLMGLTTWPWLPSARPLVLPAAAGAAAAAPVATTLPPFAHFAAIVERPLFTASRRPVAHAAATATGASLAGRFRLLGLVADGNHRRALLTDGKRAFEIGEGEALDGWTVTHILQDRLTFASPTGVAVLTLHPPAAGLPNAAVRPKR